MLRVAKENLPPGSAWHRAQNEGQQWTNVEALLWLVAHLLERLDARLVWQKRKKPKWPKFKSFPWEKSGDVVGDRGDASNEQVLAYLASMAPPGSKVREAVNRDAR